jgi:CRP-like cAMP-binding protein
VLVLGRRSGRPVQLRRWVSFDVDLETTPSDVISAVDDALQAMPIEHVASEPKAHCVLVEMVGQTGKYAVGYWLTELAKDAVTDSTVRVRIYFALKREGIAFAASSHAVQLSQSTESRAEHDKLEHERRRKALSRIDLFVDLPEDERDTLARTLRPAPFARGELMTRQGSAADWLFMIVSGEADAHVRDGAVERVVARFGPGDFFGEMSMLTGEPRTATIIALSHVESYMLDKAAFQAVVQRRPEVAEHIADVLAKRMEGLALAREDLSQEAKSRQAKKTHLLSRIRLFFSDSPPRKSTLYG